MAQVGHELPYCKHKEKDCLPAEGMLTAKRVWSLWPVAGSVSNSW